MRFASYARSQRTLWTRTCFDQKYIRQQRELMVRAYTAVRTIRLLLANHPATKGIEIPDWLYEGLIWDY